MKTPSPLTPKQRQAASLLGQGKTPSEVATALSLGRSTLHGWRKRDDFAALVEEASGKSIASLEAVVAQGRDEILKLTPDVAVVIAEGLKANTYIVDSAGGVHEIPAWSQRRGFARLQLAVTGLMTTKVEHSGEVKLRHLSDEELKDAAQRLREARSID